LHFDQYVLSNYDIDIINDAIDLKKIGFDTSLDMKSDNEIHDHSEASDDDHSKNHQSEPEDKTINDVFIEDSCMESKGINHLGSVFINCTLCQNIFMNAIESSTRVCPKCYNICHLSDDLI
jgi:hypothetical protein